jgi:hypothetical protein
MGGVRSIDESKLAFRFLLRLEQFSLQFSCKLWENHNSRIFLTMHSRINCPSVCLTAKPVHNTCVLSVEFNSSFGLFGAGFTALVRRLVRAWPAQGTDGQISYDHAHFLLARALAVLWPATALFKGFL